MSSTLGARLLSEIPRRPIVAHFDLNRTIIQVDLAGGKSLEDILNNNLASCVQGFSNNTPTSSMSSLQWKPFTDPDGQHCSTFFTKEEVAQMEEKHKMTYDEFVDEIAYPKPAQMAKLAKKEALEMWKGVTGNRRSLKNKFVEKGHPGEMFKDPFFHEMYNKMLLTPEQQQLYRSSSSSSGNNNSKCHFVIPAFFTFLDVMWQLKWPFRLVFRTFGRELKEVLADVEKVLTVRNPALWAYVSRNSCAPTSSVVSATSASSSSSSSSNEMMHSSKFPWCPISSLYRDSKLGSLVAHGASYSPSDIEEWKKDGFKPEESTLEHLYSEFTGGKHKTKKNEKEKEEEENNNKDDDGLLVRFRGFVDHYPWWAANGEHETAGKSFPVKVTPFEDEKEPFQIFFDDNAYIGDPDGHSILDLRNVDTHEHISDPKVQSCFMTKCEPRNAILDDYYFVRHFAEMAKKQNQLRGGSQSSSSSSSSSSRRK